MKRSLYPLVLILFFVSACLAEEPTPIAEIPVVLPKLELLSPPSGTRVILNSELEIETRSTDERGLDRIELWIDDKIYRVDEVGGQLSFHVIQRWWVDEAGQHKVRVQAVNVDGQTSRPATIMVEVQDPALFTATPTNTFTPAPTPTGTPTHTVTPTGIPTNTPTPTETPTNTPTPLPTSTGMPTDTPMPTPTPTSTATPMPTATSIPREPTATIAPTPTRRPTRPPAAPAGMILVPAGTFLMGSNDDHTEQAGGWCHCSPSLFEDELYMHEVYVSGFYIDKYPVTNQQFLAFANATGYQTDAEKKSEARTWRTESTPGKENHPVVWMSWNDANAYCTWAGKRLPTEAEWEKAARGTDGRTWPWGNNWDVNRLNGFDGQRRTTTAVDSFPDGASPYGAMDMAGNTWEWVNDWYGLFYYQSGEDRDPKGPASGIEKVLRGGGFDNKIHDVRTANRHKGGTTGYAPDHSFRCAK